MRDEKDPAIEHDANASFEIAALLARGYTRYRRRRAWSRAQLSAFLVNKPLDDVTPRRKVKGRGDKASQEESRE